VKALLNFEDDFRAVDSPNVYPLLARYDQIIRLSDQKSSYEDEVMTVIDKGHVTAMMASGLLREHILSCME
jgi:hypothetical protein